MISFLPAIGKRTTRNVILVLVVPLMQLIQLKHFKVDRLNGLCYLTNL